MNTEIERQRIIATVRKCLLRRLGRARYLEVVGNLDVRRVRNRVIPGSPAQYDHHRSSRRPSGLRRGSRRRRSKRQRLVAAGAARAASPHVAEAHVWTALNGG
jgi:hypothetical protein